MTSINLNFWRERNPELTLEQIKKEQVLDKGGYVSFDWKHMQCGNTIWYDLRGYIGNQSIFIRYNWL